MTTPLSTGTVLGRYRLTELLGEGGMGAVWGATHVVTGKEAALKLIARRLAASPQIKQRLVREARAASAVVHPNVVAVYDVFELGDGSPVIVLERLRGPTLADVLKRDGELPLARTAAIFLPVISAVGTAHAAGVVHRDLKPSNIVLCKRYGSEQVKVVDFGIAKLTTFESDASDPATRTGAMLGTPQYMPPEQIYGEKDIDHRADIWALGVNLFQCLTGKLPVSGDNVGQIFKAITQGDVTPIDLVAPELPADIRELVHDMLAVERNRRPTLRHVALLLSRYTDTRVPEFGPPASRPSQPDWQSWWQPPDPPPPDASPEREEPDAAKPWAAAPVEAETAKPSAVLPAEVDAAITPVTQPADPDASTQVQLDAGDAASPRTPRRRRLWLPLAVAAGTITAAGLGFLLFASRAEVALRSDVPSASTTAPHARSQMVAPSSPASAGATAGSTSATASAAQAAASVAAARRGGLGAEPPRSQPPSASAGARASSTAALPAAAASVEATEADGIVEKAPY